MKKLALLLLLMIPLLSYGGSETSLQRFMTITAKDIVFIDPPIGYPREEFDFNLGYFEIRIPKGRFVYQAPNCRSNIILRMGLVASWDKDRKELMERRWRLVQDLHAVKEGKKESVTIPLNSGPYMKRNSRGERVLEYCNAYIPRYFWKYSPDKDEKSIPEKTIEKQD